MTTQIDSTFALLDVKKGRTALRRRFERAPGLRVPVLIKGFITDQWGRDDGTSVEFTVEVTSAEELIDRETKAAP